MKCTIKDLRTSIEMVYDRVLRVDGILKELQSNGIKGWDNSSFTTTIVNGIRLELQPASQKNTFFLSIGDHITIHFGHNILDLMSHREDRQLERVIQLNDSKDGPIPEYKKFLSPEDMDALNWIVERFYAFMVSKVPELERAVSEMNNIRNPELQKGLKAIRERRFS